MVFTADALDRPAGGRRAGARLSLFTAGTPRCHAVELAHGAAAPVVTPRPGAAPPLSHLADVSHERRNADAPDCTACVYFPPERPRFVNRRQKPSRGPRLGLKVDIGELRRHLAL